MENRERSVQAQRAKPSTATENGARGKRATDEAAEKAKPLSFQASTKGARPARRACRGMAGFARHALGKGARRRRHDPAGDAGDSGDTGAPLRGDGRNRCAKRCQPRPIGPIRPICPTALFPNQLINKFPLCTFVVLRVLRDHLKTLTFLQRLIHRPAGAFRSPFSVLRSPGRRSRPFALTLLYSRCRGHLPPRKGGREGLWRGL